MVKVIDLTGRRAVVTGGGTGIGQAVAVGLAEAGAKVAVNYRGSEEEAEEVVREICEAGGEAFAVQGDVSRAEDVERVFAEVDARWGGVDVLVANAGIQGEREPAWEADVDGWQKVIEVNLIGTFLSSRAALQRMVKQGKGVIIAMGSVHEVVPWAGYSAYCATKAGIAAMNQTLAQEAAEHGVRVLTVAPGAIRTPINEEAWNDPEKHADLLSKIPYGRLGEPREVADVVAFLASDLADYITGPSLLIDGGMALAPEFRTGG
jgi:glucose 1-dehydrogenase